MSNSLLSRPQSYAIMASGTGTNALALIDQGIDIGRPPAFVIVNREDSALLKTVPTRSVPIFYIPAKNLVAHAKQHRGEIRPLRHLNHRHHWDLTNALSH